MAGSIADFKASFSTDLARPSRFDVELPIPIGLVPYRGISRRMNLRCENAELPGRTVATTAMKIYGAEEKFPYQSTFGDIALTFIVGDDMKEKLLFDAWINWINPTVNYNFKYKADYASNVRINQYDVHNNVTYSVDLLDAFPVSMNSMNLDWASDGHHRITVVFAYTSWRNNSLENLGMELIENSLAAGLNDGFRTIPQVSEQTKQELSTILPEILS